MSNVDQRFLAILDAQRRVDESLSRVEKLGGGSGGGSSIVEKRLDKLEGQFEKLREDIVGVKVQLATLTERVAHLPTKGFIVSTLGTSLAIIAALIVFADKIRALIG